MPKWVGQFKINPLESAAFRPVAAWTCRGDHWRGIMTGVLPPVSQHSQLILSKGALEILRQSTILNMRGLTYEGRIRF